MLKTPKVAITRVGLFVLLLVAILLPVQILRGQANETILSIAIPTYSAATFPVDVLRRFEDQHPGVKVNLVKVEDNARFFPSAAENSAQHFARAAQYASTADVLYVTDYTLSVEDSRAGIYLDLAPLVKADPSIQTSDFYAAAWQSFQWDTGLWAIPAAADTTIFSYDASAFDRLGLAYPNAQWSMDDLANAVTKLAKRDDAGKVVTPGLLAPDATLLLRSLLGSGFYDATTTPNPPQLATAPLATLLAAWSKLERDGLTGDTFSGDAGNVPMSLESGSQLIHDDPGHTRSIGPLPGGSTLLGVEGFAVSSGSQQPELAYDLAVFLSQQPNLLGPDTLSSWNSLNEQRAIWDKFPVDYHNLAEQALPASELRYSDYLRMALNTMKASGVDAPTTLLQEQDQSRLILQNAVTQRGTFTMAVATPTPVSVTVDATVLHFNLMAFMTPLANAKEWNTAIQDFTSTDPQIKNIIITTDDDSEFAAEASKYDCFYPAYPIPVDTTQALDLTPLMAADPTVNKDDFIGDSLIQQDNKIWGFPLDIQPELLQYNPAILSRVGLTLPVNSWTTNEFLDALKTLKADLNGAAPFIPHQDRQTDKYLLMLMAAFGGIPIDYRTTPPTIDFTTPDTVDAIRQVLDLAKQGYIQYKKLNAPFTMSGGFPINDPIFNTLINGLWASNDRSPQQGAYRLINYPTGKFTPISLGFGAAYISAQTALPEACYRWISFISKRPELLWGMPAQRSVLDSPRMSVKNPDDVAYYQQVDALSKDPNAFFIPFDYSSLTDYVVRYWLDDAFDNYVLKNADLDQQLQAAQSLATGFLGCVANIAPAQSGSADADAATYHDLALNCAIKLDARPRTKEWLGWKG